MHGSPAEFERRVLPLEKDLYALAFALTGQEADALDLVQETLLRAFRAFATFDRGDHLKAWLFTILRHAFLDRCRRRQIGPVSFDEREPADPAPRPPAAPLEDALPDDLLRALRTLSPAHQTLLLLCDVEGLRYREIADVLSCPIGSVMSGLHHARTRLREALSKR